MRHHHCRGFGPAMGMGRGMGRMGRMGGMRPGLHRFGGFGLFSMMGPLITLASFGLAYRLQRGDYRRVEQELGKSMDEASEAEIQSALEALGIKPFEKVNAKTTLEDLELLEKLTQLNYAGIITDEEFAAKRKQILGLD